MLTTQDTKDRQQNQHIMQQMLSPVSVSDTQLSPGTTTRRPHIQSQQPYMEDQLNQEQEAIGNELIHDNYSDGQHKMVRLEPNLGHIHQGQSYQSTTQSEVRTQNAPRQMTNEQQHQQVYSNPQNEPTMQASISEDSLNSKESRQFRFLNNKQSSPKKTQQPQQTLSVHQQNSNSQSSLLKQFSEKVKSQAERLQKLEAYKQLCEKRILDFDPQHSFPVTEAMIGAEALSHVPIKESSPGKQNSQHDLKRQLALKEQDLSYAKQRAEKAIKENEYLKQELQKAQQAPSMHEKSIQQNDQSLLEQVRSLEEEKNALLDYIEESVSGNDESESKCIEIYNNNHNHRLTMNEMNQKMNELGQIIKALEADKANLYQMTEDLKYQEGLSRQKISELQTQLASQVPSQRTLCSQREETFGNLPTIFQSEQFNSNQGTMKMQQTHESAANPTIDYMVLDLNNIKQELADTQNQFESTREVLQVERQEKKDLQAQLDITSARLNNIEKQWADKNLDPFSTDGTRKQNMNNTQSSVANFEQKTLDSRQQELLEAENNKMKAQVFDMNQQLDQQCEENKILKETLDETQQELESLVNDHESLSNRFAELQSKLKEAHDQPGKLRQEAQGIRDMLDERCNEIVVLQSEIKSMADQAEIQTETIKSLRAQNIKLEADMTGIKAEEESKNKNQAMKLESTVEDLTKELKEVREMLVDKQNMHARVEKELRTKLSEVEEAHGQKSNLLRRIEDLNFEVRSMQTEKEKKDTKLKNQMKQNEELRLELERINITMQTVKMEKEQTVDMRKEDNVALEAAQSRVEKQTKVINKICRDVGKVQDLVQTLSKEFCLPNKTNTHAMEDGRSRPPVKQLDEQLREANSFLKQVGEWLVQFAKLYKQNLRKQDNQQNEIEIANQKVNSMETKYRTLQTDDQESREKERYLAVEVQQLKCQLHEISSQQKEGYQREERIHKQNQTIKSQLDACRIQKDKLALQLKTLLSEKESLKEHNELKEEEFAEQDEKGKALELQISTLVEQKHQILDLMSRAKEAFPSETLKDVFGQIIESVHEGFQIEEDYLETENALLSKEGELRQYAKREVDGLLSTKVINIRKDVDKGRQSLREISQKKEDLEKKQAQLEFDLKNTENVERRRTDVALETEQNLHKTKQELQMLRQEFEFVTRNRSDIEIALKAAQQEKAMVERELLALRHQLKVQAGPNSTLRNINSYNATKSEFLNDMNLGPLGGTGTLREPQPTAKFPTQTLESYRDKNNSSSNKQLFIGDGQDSKDMPLKRSRFSSYEPARRSQDLLSEPENISPNVQQIHHQQVNSDLPRQMPHLSEREGSNQRARAVLFSHGRVMSSDGTNPNATTAAQSSTDIFKPHSLNERPPLNKHEKQEYHQQSARLPPTYQSSTSASKNKAGFNGYSQPISTTNSKNQNYTSVPLNPISQYTTGSFPIGEKGEQHAEQIHFQPTPAPSSHLYSLRNVVTASQNSGRSSSLAALQNAGTMYKNHTSSIGDPLQPIPSQYGGELLSSRTMSHTVPTHEHTPVNQTSPLRNSNMRNVHSYTQKSQNRRDHQSLGERESYIKTAGNSTASGLINQTHDSSVQHKLSQLRNVFTSIRQNLQDDSELTAQATLQQLHSAHRNYHHQSSIGHSSGGMIHNQDY